MKTKNLIFTVILSFVIFSASAQFTVDGSFRTRFQALHGYKTPVNNETEAVFGADQQSRLIFNYKTEKYSAKFTLQDARVWGSEDFYNVTGPQRSSYSLGVYEAWVELKTGAKSSIRVGRQEWKYNGCRILCHRGWWTTGLSYDAFLYKYADKESGLFVDFGISYNNNTNTASGAYVNSFSGRLKTMNFLNVKKKVGDKLVVNLNLLLTGQQDDLNENTLYAKGTEGIFINYNIGKKATDGLFGTLSAYYQHGTQAMGVSTGSATPGGWQSVNAYMFDAGIGFRMMEKKLEISAGVEMISGHDYVKGGETDDNGDLVDSTYQYTTHTFDLFQGGGHPYYGGNMDYFRSMKSMKAGLMDPYFKVKYKLSKKNWIGLNVWMPMLANDMYTKRDVDITDPSKGKVKYDKALGTNLDFSYGHKLSPDVKVVAGVSFAMISDSYKEMKGLRTFGDHDNDATTDFTWEDNAGQQYFVYAMLIITPKFFSSEKK